MKLSRDPRRSVINLVMPGSVLNLYTQGVVTCNVDFVFKRWKAMSLAPAKRLTTLRVAHFSTWNRRFLPR